MRSSDKPCHTMAVTFLKGTNSDINPFFIEMLDILFIMDFFPLILFS